MTRRGFLAFGAAAPFEATAQTGPVPMGINTYCLRALKWNDAQLLDYCAVQKMDAIFLQDSLDPRAMEAAHWREVKARAAELRLHLETGTGAVLPKSREAFEGSVRMLRQGIDRAAAMGSPIVRCLHAADREHLPPGPVEQSIESMIQVLRAVRSQCMDAGLKIAIENHKDLQARERRQVIEGAGREFVGSYLDTGNPVFVLEHPMTTLEVLGPYALTVHLRDSVVYEHEGGVAVQWVPLGEGTVDFRAFIARMRELCPPVYVYIKPITGRPPQVLRYLDAAFWKAYPNARAAGLARFLALAKSGRPYEDHAVIEDVPGRPLPEEFTEAIKYQQREHMERSVKYAREKLGLGIRWRA